MPVLRRDGLLPSTNPTEMELRLRSGIPLIGTEAENMEETQYLKFSHKTSEALA